MRIYALRPTGASFGASMPRRHPPDSEPPPHYDTARKRLESVIPDLIKKAVIGGVERGYESADAVRNFITEQKLPKEIANAILSQLDETKNGLFRVVAKELRSFLEAVDWQRELQKLLTTVSFEIKTEIRFIPNDAAPEKLGRPEVKAGMKVKRNRIDEERRAKKKRRTQRTPEEERRAADQADQDAENDTETSEPGEVEESLPPPEVSPEDSEL